MVVDADLVEVSLRRYSSEACSEPFGYHNASVVIDVVSQQLTDGGYVEPGPSLDRSDPRWPSVCPCGYTFVSADEWQTNYEPMYKRQDTGEVLGTIRTLPPGAIWDGWWMRGRREPFIEEREQETTVEVQETSGVRTVNWCGPDGLCLIVRLPNGHEWHIDGAASNGGGWTRTGVPPKLTVTPSVLARDYHGFLTNGELVPC